MLSDATSIVSELYVDGALRGRLQSLLAFYTSLVCNKLKGRRLVSNEKLLTAHMIGLFRRSHKLDRTLDVNDLCSAMFTGILDWQQHFVWDLKTSRSISSITCAVVLKQSRFMAVDKGTEKMDVDRQRRGEVADPKSGSGQSLPAYAKSSKR